jgi:NOL1/NOP2/fmu family ribosome biogenesis protein
LSSAWLNPEEEARAFGYLEERFGIPPEAFADHRLLLRGENLCAVRRETEELWDTLAVAYGGLKLLKLTGSGGYKPSSRGVQVFGRTATRNAVDLTDEELRALVEGRSLPQPEGRGFVILRCRGVAVGVGLVRDAQLVSQLPRSVTMHLRMPRAGSAL